MKADRNERAAPPSCWELVKFELKLKYCRREFRVTAALEGNVLIEDFTPLKKWQDNDEDVKFSSNLFRSFFFLYLGESNMSKERISWSFVVDTVKKWSWNVGFVV